MISVVEAVDLAAQIYTGQGFDRVENTDDDYYGIKQVGDCLTFTFRGSKSAIDWLRDGLASPYDHPLIGHVHFGAWLGMQDVLDDVMPLITKVKSVSIQGHSLGCMRAAFTAGICLYYGIKIDQLVMAAPPKGGYQKLHDMLAAIPSLVALRNEWDEVPELPAPLPGFPWCEMAKYTDIAVHDDIDPHSSINYQAGARLLFSAA
jgi:hypothetical protein